MSRRVLRSLASTASAFLFSCSALQAQQFCATDTADTGEVEAFTKGAVQIGIDTIELQQDEASAPIDSTSTPTGDRLKQGLEKASASWNTACPGGKTPDLALNVNTTRDMSDGQNFVSTFGVRYRLNEQTPLGTDNVEVFAVFHEQTGVLEVYGQCINKNSELNEAICMEVGSNLYIDWSHDWAVSYLEHELGHGFGVGHDRGDGSCGSFNGVMSSPVNYRQGSIKPEHCAIADFQSCEPGIGECPRHPALPDDPVADRPDLCTIVPELCIEPTPGVNNPWWMVSSETQPDCYLAVVEVDGVTTVQRHCESLGGGGGGSAFTGPTPGPESGFHHPTEGAIVGGTLQLDGWSLDDDGGVTGTLGFWLDGQPALVTGATYGEHDPVACSGRVDPACPYVGFSGALDTTVLADGTHSIELVTSETAPERPTPGYAKTTFMVDNTQPTAAITPPAYGATVSGTVSVTASASDTNGINLVSFYVDGAYQATDSAAPYSFSWNSAGWPNGSHTLKIVAWDEAGNSRTITRSVTLSNDLQTPQISVSLPANGALVRGTVTFRAVATDDQGVSHVELYRNGVLVKTDPVLPYQWAWNTTAGPDGSYTLTARAYDAAGNVGVSAPVTVTVDNTLPARFVDNPSHQQIVGGTSVMMKGWAIDSSGVASYAFAIDGQPLAVTNLVTNLNRSGVCSAYPSIQDPACPYVGWRAYFDATQFSDGAHTLTLTVQDAAGNAISFDRQIFVDNPPSMATFYPVADATAWQAYPTNNDGTSATLVTRTTSDGEGAYAFLKFDVSGITGTVVSAQLEFRTDSSMHDLWLYWLTSNAWTESSITWSSFPGPGGTLDYRYNLAGSTWYTYDVSSFVTGNGAYSMGFAGSNSTYAHVWSRQSSYPPVLRVMYQP